MADEHGTSAALAHLGLETPLRDISAPRVEELAVRRMWEGIQQRKARRTGGAWRLVAVTALVTLALTLVLGVASGLFEPDPGVEPGAGVEPGTGLPSVTGAAEPVARGPLLTRDARRFESLEAPPALETSTRRAPARVEFADGSSIEAAPGARVDALAATADEFVVLVRRGRADFRVTPGGPRRWRIEARDARVEVVGTVLSVESDDASTRVTVDEGRVLVRSPQLPGGVQSIGAGESLRVEVEPRRGPPALGARDVDPAGAASAGAGSMEAGSMEAGPTADRPEGVGSAGAVRRKAESHGAAAVRRPRSTPMDRAPRRAADLWEDIDAARRRGRSAQAATLLERLVREYPDDSQAGLAAFTLGVLELDHLGHPASAASSFERALELGIGLALRQDAYLRWAEALARAGAYAKIHSVLAEYRRLYPQGRHRSAIERLLAHPSAP